MTETPFSRLEPALAANAIDGVLLTSPASLAYFADYETQIESGAAPWLPCPAALLWLHGQSPVLFLAEGEDAPPDSVFNQVRFAGYVYREPLPGIQSLIVALETQLGSCAHATIGVELACLPAAVLVALTESFRNCASLRFLPPWASCEPSRHPQSSSASGGLCASAIAVSALQSSTHARG
jgi:Xaa-Pro aminopeptidase